MFKTIKSQLSTIIELLAEIEQNGRDVDIRGCTDTEGNFTKELVELLRKHGKSGVMYNMTLTLEEGVLTVGGEEGWSIQCMIYKGFEDVHYNGPIPKGAEGES